jgi:hypothetical protein
MKEQRRILKDIIGVDQPVNESKANKYIRIALVCIGLAFFVYVIVMAALRRYGT